MIVQTDIDDDLWAAIEARYQNGDYTGAIQDCFVFLGNLLRDKADVSADGVDLVNKAFSESSPKIKVNKLETQSDADEQKGIGNLLRGLYQSVRNPRSHEKYNDSEQSAIAVISFVSYLVVKIRGSTGQFEIDPFIELVTDKRFVKTEEYCDALVAEIPERKFFDTMISLYKQKVTIDVYNVQYIFQALLKRAKPNQIESLVKIIGEELRRTTNDIEIKYIFRILNQELWSQIESVARIRTENRIVEGIKESHYLPTWCTAMFPVFKNRDALYSAMETRVSSEKDEDIEYFYKYMFRSVFDLISPEQVLKTDPDDVFFIPTPFFLYTIGSSIEKGSSIHYQNIKSMWFGLPVHIKTYLEPSIQKYDENKKASDEVEYDPEVEF
jgi:uncharacterized protein (TIGR02391 family)